ncbi:hypothetical protein ACJ41O_006686 [Fusarium nematophilum]
MLDTFLFLDPTTSLQLSPSSYSFYMRGVTQSLDPTSRYAVGPIRSSEETVACSGTLPCSNCQRRQINCDFSSTIKSNALIDMGNGEPAGKPATLPPGYRFQAHLQRPKADETLYMFNYFDAFLLKNKFNQRSVFSADIIDLTQDSTSGTYLRDAVLSLGAMQAVKVGSPEGMNPSQSYAFALNHYSKSVAGLRGALGQFEASPGSLESILWTTHLLGLFELMSDSTGQGWVQHLVHGTASALVAAGPLAFQSGRGSRFFLEIKIFEVCRAIVFNEETFLADPGWRNLSVSLRGTAEGRVHPLDALLDVIVSCSTLRVRARDFICYLEGVEPDSALIDGQDIALEGFSLREDLNHWQQTEETLTKDPISGSDEFMSLATVFFSATSIYLSGVFDYEMMHWQKLGILVPNLSEDEIQAHVQSILSLSRAILGSSSISPLLLLFPLRVAGARSWYRWQQECIRGLLEMIERTFSAATAFKLQLGEIWCLREQLMSTPTA